jgi:hypothetical protein
LAIKRTSSNSLVNATKMSTGFSSAAIPNAPTIGAATATSDVAATVAYTAAVLGANGVTFTATSNPSSITGTGSSPITVTGLTASTSYTFTVTAGNANGTSAASSASNSITTSATLTSYESIATANGTGSSATITFSSIPSTYTHLQIRAITRDTSAFNDSYGAKLKINSDTGSNYVSHYLLGNGSSATPGSQGTSITPPNCMQTAGGGMAANVFSATIIDILDYKNTNKYKTVRVLTGVEPNSATGDNVGLQSALWMNTNAITQIDITSDSGGNWATGTQFALYGIKGA